MNRTARFWAGYDEKVMTMVDLMNLEDQVDLDLTLARRRARLGRLKALLLGRGITVRLPRKGRTRGPLSPVYSRRLDPITVTV